MELFQFTNHVVTFSPQALALKPFKALWDRDKSKDKKRAIGELSFLYYLVDYRSDFSNIIDEETRYAEVLRVINLGKTWKPDKKFEAAKELYVELQKTPAIEALEAVRIGLDKINQFMKDVDLNEKNDRGQLLHKPSDIMAMAKMLEPALDSLSKVEERVKKEIENKSEFKGANKPAMFEDGIPSKD